ncbi:MAG: lytic murein transglycosylase [Candidatus Kaiserbacteria bacterium]|nr:lytic murein transglycosylase [Candidatus Kaiserbacteria bacterium]
MFKKAVLAFILFVVVFSSCFAVSQHVTRAQDLTPEERAALQSQYDELQKEIAIQQQIIKDTQAKKNTLQGDVTLLNAQIKAAQAQIDAKNITIKQLAAQIVKKNAVIGQLSDRITRGKESLASILRQTQILDDYSIVSVALGSQSVSEFFSDLDTFTSIKVNLQNLFTDIQSAKVQTESEKAALAAKQNQTADAKYIVETQQKQISSDKTQKQQLLSITANQEAEYKKILADRQAKAAAIRAALFPLRDASAISFGLALQYAQQAQKVTGVDPALALAILTQESNLGANVGQCYLTNDVTGAGIGKNTGTAFSKVMSPTRDVPPFLALGLQLGFDPHHQVVSCPIASAGGWGGAMGPAQFIPSTWALYADRVAAGSGESVANPWDPKDAIMAMSFLLADNGADAGGYTAEYTAAARYYAGWNGAATGAWKSYAAQVMNTVKNTIQPNIDFLANN